jgi:uncharacterized protein YdaU (DUF1376 family)
MARPARGEPQKPPAFQFYPKAWLSSTFGMSREIKGAYIDLLAYEWDNGPLPHSPAWRARALGTDAKNGARIWAALRSKFVRTARGWINRRLEGQRRELAAHRAQAKTAAAARWDGPKSKRASSEHAASMPDGHAQAMLPSMGAASNGHVLNGCTPTPSPTPSPTPKRTNRRRTAGYASPPFKVYAAIARRAFDEEPTNDDRGAVAERMKRFFAQQHKACDVEMMGRAIRAVEVARAKHTRT